MLTPATTTVDATPRAVMWPIGKIAERDGVSKQAVSKKARALVEKHGLSVDRDDRGRIAAVNVAEYDHLRGRFGDPSKAQAPRPTANAAAPASQPAPANESYDEALRQKTWHEAERRRLELEELKGELIRVARVADALQVCGEEINRIVDRLPSMTDDLANAVARDGSHGLRVALKRLAARIRGEIAEAMRTIASRAPEQEDESEPTAPEKVAA